MLDPDNQAVAKAMQIPPALLQEILEGNEEALAGLARVQLAYLMEIMTQRCASENTSPSGASAIMEILRKIAAGNKADAGTGGPGVVINITRAKDRDEAITIEGVADKLPAEV